MKTTLVSTPFRILALISSLVWGSSASAKDLYSALDPHVVVQSAAEDVINLVKDRGHSYSDNPKPLLKAADRILRPLVDFKGISRSVMSPFDLAASERQRLLFEKTFRRHVIELYVDILVRLDTGSIQFVAVQTARRDSRALVTLQIQSGQQGTFELSFAMLQTPKGQWKVSNMVFGETNLGVTFQHLFAQSYAAHKGNLDQVIASWGKGSLPKI